MATPPPPLNRSLQALAAELGEQIRAQRKSLKVSAISAAEAAGMSRVTWHRIEKGKVSVTVGSYMLAAHVVGLAVSLKPTGTLEQTDHAPAIPVKIPLSDYPQLRYLAWQVTRTDTLSPVEALDFYERNWRHVDEQALTQKECELIDALRVALGKVS